MNSHEKPVLPTSADGNRFDRRYFHELLWT